VGTFELTSTQLKKSIIDANAGIRNSFSQSGYHDFETQEAGPDGRVRFEVTAVTREGTQQTTLSLYRARSNHDPRFWIARLNAIFQTARSGDLFVIAQDGRNAVIVNASDLELDEMTKTRIATAFGL